MHNPGRNVNHCAFTDLMRHTVHGNDALAFKYVIKFGRTLVIVRPGTVNVHGMRPGRRCQWRIFLANQAVSPTTSTPLSRSMALMPNENAVERI